MALRADELEEGRLYERYLEALARHGEVEKLPSDEPRATVVRHCSSCGMHTVFRLDPEGTWYECTHCQHYA